MMALHIARKRPGGQLTLIVSEIFTLSSMAALTFGLSAVWPFKFSLLGHPKGGIGHDEGKFTRGDLRIVASAAIGVTDLPQTTGPHDAHRGVIQFFAARIRFLASPTCARSFARQSLRYWLSCTQNGDQANSDEARLLKRRSLEWQCPMPHGMPF